MQAAAGGEGDRVDDRRVAGTRATSSARGRAARRARAPGRGARRPASRSSALTSSADEPLELPVVVEQAPPRHRRARRPTGEARDPGPMMSRSQIVNTTPPIAAVDGEDAADHALALVDAGRAPDEDPGVVDALEHASGRRTARRAARRTRRRSPAPTLSVQYCTREAIHSAPAGIGPQKSRLTTTSSASSARAISRSTCRRPAPTRAPGCRRYFDRRASPAGGRRTGRRCRWDRCARRTG